MRKRARRSELTWGYSLPPWFEDAGLKSSTAGAVLGRRGLGLRGLRQGELAGQQGQQQEGDRRVLS